MIQLSSDTDKPYLVIIHFESRIMKKLLYYLKVSLMLIMMSMAAFGLVMPGTFATRKRYSNKDITIEQVEPIAEDVWEEVVDENEI